VRHRRFTIDDWFHVLFSDEASFSVGKRDGRYFCYRRKNERYLEKNILEHSNRGYACISVWGGIVRNEKLPLIQIDGMMNTLQVTSVSCKY